MSHRDPAPGKWRTGPSLRAFGTALCAVLIAACATTGGADREAASLERLKAAAGEPVASFRFFSLQGYTALGEEHVAVWTRPREAWLVKVDAPCFDLGWTSSIGLSSSLGRVHARFDRVLVGGQRCRIAEIRPIDVDALRESEREARREGVELHARDEPREAGAAAQSAGGT